jgi:hypothetical protein
MRGDAELPAHRAHTGAPEPGTLGTAPTSSATGAIGPRRWGLLARGLERFELAASLGELLAERGDLVAQSALASHRLAQLGHERRVLQRERLPVLLGVRSTILGITQALLERLPALLGVRSTILGITQALLERLLLGEPQGLLLRLLLRQGRLVVALLERPGLGLRLQGQEALEPDAQPHGELVELLERGRASADDELVDRRGNDAGALRELGLTEALLGEQSLEALREAQGPPRLVVFELRGIIGHGTSRASFAVFEAILPKRGVLS